MNYELAEPKASVLIESLRSVGYSLSTAIADIIDNSIAAKARQVEVEMIWAGADTRIALVDDGDGMPEAKLSEAMRPGTKNPLETRSADDLGRFGLGLKTASFSQCRNLTVISKARGSPLAVRCWDLNYVASCDEWRLLKEAPSGAVQWLDRINSAASGTAVVWTALDRVTGGESTADAAAQHRFNLAVSAVGNHLAMVFHRFIESGQLRIQLNGISLKPWNPFMEYHDATYRTPVERIPHSTTFVEFRGFVLPHKDKLSDEEIVSAGGPRGWNAQQGFYVYRNRRLLVGGEWLRLGRTGAWTKDKQYELARIRLDITNEKDGEWQLDVKKSTATPPAQIRERLADLAEELRGRARGVFVHRGLYGARATAPREIERPWTSTIRQGHRVYSINRSHPLVRSVLEGAGQQSAAIESLLRLVEETVPVQQIWLDTAEQPNPQGAPYEGVQFEVIRGDLRTLFNVFIGSGINETTARERLKNMEPFNRFPALVDEL